MRWGGAEAAGEGESRSGVTRAVEWEHWQGKSRRTGRPQHRASLPLPSLPLLSLHFCAPGSSRSTSHAHPCLASLQCIWYHAQRQQRLRPPYQNRADIIFIVGLLRGLPPASLLLCLRRLPLRLLAAATRGLPAFGFLLAHGYCSRSSSMAPATSQRTGSQALHRAGLADVFLSLALTRTSAFADSAVAGGATCYQQPCRSPLLRLPVLRMCYHIRNVMSGCQLQAAVYRVPIPIQRLPSSRDDYGVPPACILHSL